MRTREEIEKELINTALLATNNVQITNIYLSTIKEAVLDIRDLLEAQANNSNER